MQLSRSHLALIRACTAAPDDVGAAIDAWIAGVDLDELDLASTQLLGFVYRRMLEVDLDHPSRPVLAGRYRRTWHGNQVLLFRARPLLARIGELTGRAVVLKGGAMISTAYFDDLGIRPLYDLDVLIERNAVEAVVEWALSHDWHVLKGLSAEDIYTVHHAIDLVYGDDGAVDLHWALLVHGRNPTRDREFLESALPAEIGGVPIHVLQPTAQLFHTATHVKPVGIRHLVDVISIIERHREELDWSALVDEVIGRRTIAYATRTFALVEQAKPGTIPASTLARLSQARRHWSDDIFEDDGLDSRRRLVRRFAAEVATRSRGGSPVEKLRVSRSMIRRYRQSSGLSGRDLAKGFLTRGGSGPDGRSDSNGDASRQ